MRVAGTTGRQYIEHVLDNISTDTANGEEWFASTNVVMNLKYKPSAQGMLAIFNQLDKYKNNLKDGLVQDDQLMTMAKQALLNSVHDPARVDPVNDKWDKKVLANTSSTALGWAEYKKFYIDETKKLYTLKNEHFAV